ncbi:MAG: RNA-binding domain-containing protein [Promethearchaeota archaeon]
MDCGEIEMVSKSPTGSSALVKLRQIEIRTFIHATESKSKIILPITKLLHPHFKPNENTEDNQGMEKSNGIENVENVENVKQIESIDQVGNIEELKDDRLKPVRCVGSHGQFIDSLTLKITTKREIQDFLEQLAQQIPLNFKIQLESELAQRTDEKFKVFLRFDKQAAILGKFILVSHSDVYIIILAFQNKNPKCAMTLEDIRTYLKQHRLLETN